MLTLIGRVPSVILSIMQFSVLSPSKAPDTRLLAQETNAKDRCSGTLVECWAGSGDQGDGLALGQRATASEKSVRLYDRNARLSASRESLARMKEMRPRKLMMSSAVWLGQGAAAAADIAAAAAVVPAAEGAVDAPPTAPAVAASPEAAEAAAVPGAAPETHQVSGAFSTNFLFFKPKKQHQQMCRSELDNTASP